MNYRGFNIEPFCSDVCGDHRRPQTLAEICRNMDSCCGFRAVAAREKYPGLTLFVLTREKSWKVLITGPVLGKSTGGRWFPLIKVSDAESCSCGDVIMTSKCSPLGPCNDTYTSVERITAYPDRKVHGANMGPIWGRQDPSGPHVGPMNLAIWARAFFVRRQQVRSRIGRILRCIQWNGKGRCVQ